MQPATYILPIRATKYTVDDELTRYLRRIAHYCELIVVDGSEPDVFEAAHEAWSDFALHIPPSPDFTGRNGKVRGVLTGVKNASHERVVIADDDVRYSDAALGRALDALDESDLVRPQNYFDPLAWHASWDTARTLLNRGLGRADFPGTFAVRRSALRRVGGYDADVLFENLELIRTIEAAGGRVLSPRDLYVRRLPPSTRHFWSQRCRQAYDELARPWRFAAFLTLLPLTVFSLLRGKVMPVGMGAAVAIALAEAGRRRAGGQAVFPSSASWYAPLWLAERSVCTWLALAARARGGCPYAGGRLRTAATPTPVLRRRMQRDTDPAHPGLRRASGARGA